MEGHCSTGQSPQRAVAPMEVEEGNWKNFLLLRFRQERDFIPLPLLRKQTNQSNVVSTSLP